MAEQHAEDDRWLRKAIALSRRCPPSGSAYAVGAVIVDPSGRQLATGYSRETSPLVHAEQVAVGKLDTAEPLPPGTTIYSSMEPCTSRRSYPVTCTDMIIDAGISRVVLALREPPFFVHCEGVRLLREAGVEVVEIPELGDQVLAVNAATLLTEVGPR